MKSTVFRRPIFVCALRAQVEDTHRSVWPVVRNTPHNAESRPTVGAIHERVAISSISWVEKFSDALFTYGHIGRDHCSGSRVSSRVTYQECALSHRINRFTTRLEDASKRRRFFEKAYFKGVEIDLGSLNLYEHPFAGIAYEPC
jgi:hypothetical protein